MPVRIRLQRRGKKGQPFYHIVVADGRAPRDGRFIEKIGTYNPLTHPSTIVLNEDRAFYWVNCGAQPSDTARLLLRREGIYLRKHLMGGVAKGALTTEQAEAKLAAWKEEKAHKLNEMKLQSVNSQRDEMKQRLLAEQKVNEVKAAALAEKRQAAIAAQEAEKAAAATEENKVTDEATEATTAPVEE